MMTIVMVHKAVNTTIHYDKNPKGGLEFHQEIKEWPRIPWLPRKPLQPPDITHVTALCNINSKDVTVNIKTHTGGTRSNTKLYKGV